MQFNFKSQVKVSTRCRHPVVDQTHVGRGERCNTIPRLYWLNLATICTLTLLRLLEKN